MSRASRYIEATESLATARTNLLEIVRPIGVTALSDVVDIYTQASALAVLSDIRYREAERREIFEPDNDHSRQLRRSADLQNEACIELLGEPAQSAVSRLQTAFADTPITPRSLDIFHGQVQEALIETDFKAADVGKFLEQADKTFSIARESGVNGVCSELLKGGDHLVALRKRRAEHNDPVSTVIGGVAIALGSLILGLCAATSGGACRDSAALAIGGCLIGFGIIALIVGLVGPALS